MLPVTVRFNAGRLAPLLVLLSLAACAVESGVSDRAKAPGHGGRGGAVATASPHKKVGNPYFVKGVRYVPREDPTYDREGIASWYGPQFHGKLTANGELFDMDRLTAAHKTLPLPSLVRITNVENGKSIVVRLNDRGPFAGDRIIDLSRGTARALGTLEKGLARVRVQYLGPADLEHAIVRIGEPETYAALDPDRVARRDPAPRFGDASQELSADALTLAAATAGNAAVPEAIHSSPAPESDTVTLPPIAGTNGQAARVPTLKPGGDEAMVVVDARMPRLKPETTDGLTVVAGARIPSAKPSLPRTPMPAGTRPPPSAEPIAIVFENAPIPADPVPDVAPFYVQVGAFADANNAARAAAQFPTATPVSLEEITLSNQPTQRLRLGPYDHEFAAEAALRAAVARGFGDARIIRPEPSL